MRITWNAPVTLTFSLICCALLAADTFLGMNLIKAYFVTPSYVNVVSPGFYFQLASHSLGHANWSHLSANLFVILMLGAILEEKYGSMRLFQLMVLTAVITALLNLFFFPNTLLLGASGVVFMYIILASVANASQGEIPLTFIIVAVIFIGQEVLNSIKADNISQFAHIVGGVVGALAGLALARPKRHEQQESEVS